MDVPEWELPPVKPFDWTEAVPVNSAPSPDLDVPETEGQHTEHVEHWVHRGIDVVHFGETLHYLHSLSEGGAVAAGAAEITPLGAVLVVVVTFMELHKAFTTSQRIETQKGVTYGLMWEVLGLPDAEHTTRGGPFGPQDLTESEREAWEEGVKEGREKAKDPAVREQIERALAYEMMVQKRDLATDPQHRAWNVAVDKTLNRIWDQVHEDLPTLNYPLSWMGNKDGFPEPAPKP